MWKIFESDRLTMYLVIVSLLFSGVVMHELFFKGVNFKDCLNYLANVATIAATVFAFWVYRSWKQATNKSEVHKLVIEFAVLLQSYNVTIARLLHPSNKEQFIEDYESWSSVYLKLLEFKANYNLLTNNNNLSFMELDLPELALLEGRFNHIRVIHMHACNDFDLPLSQGPSLLYEMFKCNVKKNGKYNRFSLAWRTDFCYETISFKDPIIELQRLTHSG